MEFLYNVDGENGDSEYCDACMIAVPRDDLQHCICGEAVCPHCWFMWEHDKHGTEDDPDQA